MIRVWLWMLLVLAHAHALHDPIARQKLVPPYVMPLAPEKGTAR